jgi:hypothetical protein
MHALLCLTIFLGLAPAPNPTLPDGFYEILDKGAGTSFPCNDGRELILGKASARSLALRRSARGTTATQTSASFSKALRSCGTVRNRS